MLFSWIYFGSLKDDCIFVSARYAEIGSKAMLLQSSHPVSPGSAGLLRSYWSKALEAYAVKIIHPETALFLCINWGL
jgi:hypothetical protein